MGIEGDTVTITGENFDTGVSDPLVTICGASASVNSFSDTSIEVLAPACGVNECVDVVVTTSAGMTTSVEGFCYEEPIGGQFKRGDSNNDGATNLPDAQYSLNNLFLGGPDPACPDAADANDDGGFNIADAQYTLNFLFLGGPPPKDPGQVTCGVDPTTDDTLGECLDPRNTCP